MRTALAGEASGTVTAVAVNIVNTHAAILTRIRFTLVDIFKTKDDSHINCKACQPESGPEKIKRLFG